MSAPDAAVRAQSRRRQWGAEQRSAPLSIVHPRPSSLKLTLGRLAILVTILSWGIYVVTTIIRELLDNRDLIDFRFVMELVSYLLVVSVLTFSALMYLLARQGALYRFLDHRRVPRAELDRHFAQHYDKGITVLIPSYVEEISVVRKTLWSAALQEFPSMRIVLLIDDPPNPTDPERIESLEATRALPGEIEATLAVPRARFAESRRWVQEQLTSKSGDRGAALERVADEYGYAAEWLEDMAAAEQVEDHMDVFFVERVLIGLASELRLSELALRAAIEQSASPEPERLLELLSRLEWIFSASLTSFERKQYRSLSHEANKAMNLNAYISLIGHDWTAVDTADGTVLRKAQPGERVDLAVPDSEYLLTLDADSMLLRDYCIRLVAFLEQPDNARVAVTQTPYSSYRGAPTRIERIAGATTDVQHILHQGMTYYGATFWVGANAVIRKRALDDIASTETVGGFEVTTYIQDRTVIEDTESSIDITAHDWTLVNYPERLSYSATPPDFGSLIVQRRRWADGGLLILPKLFRQNRELRRQREPVLFRGTLLRVNYMASIAWASFGLLFLLAYPYDSRLLSVWVFFAAVPYFLCMGWDLRDSGHRFSDIARIYGFNLVLLAVNLAGVIKSLQQAVTGEKIPFARTPKVRNRTAAPPIYIIVPWAIVAFSLLTFWRDVNAQNWGNAAFAALNALLCAWAIVAYIGVWNSVVDVVLGAVDWLFVPQRPKAPKRADASGEPVDWQGILYHGDRRLSRDLNRPLDRRRRAVK